MQGFAKNHAWLGIYRIRHYFMKVITALHWKDVILPAQ